MKKEVKLMRKLQAALMIATLMLGILLSVAMASATPTVLSANDGEDDHDPREGNDVTGDEESDGDHREGTKDEGGSEEDEDVGDEDENDKASEEEGEEEDEEEHEEEGEEPEVEEDEGDEDEEAKDAMEAIREAEEQVLKASGKIEEAEAEGLAMSDVRSLLDEANSTLSDARAAYGEGNYEGAEQLAEEVKYMAEKAKHLAEDILAKSEETEHSSEEEDEEEHEKLESEEDEEGDLHITSRDNTIEFKKDKPKIEFEYTKNENEIEFEADDFAIIEFLDRDGDGKIQEDEIMKSLDFEDASWNVTYRRETVDDNTIITVTYYANTTEYEITIIMHVYQKSITGSSSTQNATVVFDVDGGADEVKFDLIVSRWTWTNETSQLALFMRLEAEVEGEVTFEQASVDEDQIVVRLDDIGIKVSWVKKAEVDGELVDVTVAYDSMELELEGGEVELELDVYFMYPHFGEKELVHDPSIGIEDDPVLYIFILVTPELMIATGVTAITIVAVTIALAQRRKLPSLNM